MEKKSNKDKKAGKYYEAVGRRKTSVARVRLFTAGKKGELTVNGRPGEKYFSAPDLKKISEEALEAANPSERFSISAKIEGGGIHSQAEALRHGISRALTKFDANLRLLLKKEGFLTRDPRAKERRKFGLKKARKAPQWAKR